MKQCKTCGGIYAPIQADGSEYYHACPDLSDADVIAALGLPADRATWTRGQQRQFDTAPKTRPNARDENVVATEKADAKRTIKSPGAGAVDVP